MSRFSVIALTATATSLFACGGVSDQFSHPSEVASVSSATPAEAGTCGVASAAQAGPAAGAPAGGGGSTLPDMNLPAAGAPDVPPVDTSQPPPPVPTRQCVEERCNGLDDDCDGVIDEGCPTALFPGFPAQRPSIGDSAGGGEFADSCASDEVLVGLNVAVGAWLDQVSAVCQKYSLTHSAQDPYQYEISLGEKRSLAAQPATTASPVSNLSCHDGSVLVGVRVSQQHSASGQANDFIVIPQLTLTCAELFIQLGGAQPHVEWMNPVQMGPITGSFANQQAWFRTDSLEVNQVPSGFHGATGNWVDRIGLTANPLGVLLESE